MARGPLRIEQFMGQARLGTTVGGVASSLAVEGEALAGVSRKLAAQADGLAARAGALDGTQAGLDGTPTLRRTGSAYSDAFDQAAMRTYADKLDTKLYRAADALALQHENDPAALRAGFATLKEEMLGADVLPDPLARSAFESAFSRVELGYVRAADRAAQTRARQAQAAGATEALVAAQANLERQGYALGLDPDGLAATEAEAKKVGDIARRAEASGAITPGAAQRLTKTLDADRATAHLKGAFDQLPSGERKAFIEKVAADFKAGTGLAGKLDLDGYERLTNAFERELSAANVATTQAQNTLKTQAGAIQKLASEGYGIAPEQWKAIETAAAAVPEGPETVSLLRREADYFHTLAARSPAEAEASIAALKAQTGDGGATVLTAARNQRADAFLKTMTTQLKEDPLGWGERAGIARVPALDFADPASFARRADAAEAVASHYGTTPVYLRPQERAALARNVEQGGDAMLSVVNGIASGFGARAPAVLREVSANSPVLAHVGGVTLAGGSPELAEDVAEAIKMRRDPAFKPPNWKPQPFRDMAAEVLGRAFLAAPDALRSAETTAKMAFEARVYRRGLSPTLGDEDSKAAFERTLQEAAGATFDRDGVQWGGVTDRQVGGLLGFGGRRDKVLVPPSMRADKFADVVDALKDEDLGPYAPKAAKLGAAWLVAVEPGRYRVALGDPAGDDPQWWRATDGKDWLLDLNALAPTLRQRVQGAFR